MCISFIYMGDDSSFDEHYHLVIVNNRDEFYTRPTKAADQWQDFPDCISGLDVEKGREGGTWFGVSKFGKIGILLNILSPQGPEASKRGRGHLVSDFLTSSSDALTYLSQIKSSAPEYNLFNLVLFEKSSTSWKGYYLTNGLDMQPEILHPGLHGVSNSLWSTPFQKVNYGKRKFQSIIGQFNKSSTKDMLQNELFSLMADKTCTLPDPQLELQAGSGVAGKYLSERSGIYVDARQVLYGTRTTTLFLCDKKGNCEFIEKTMRDPIDPNFPQWDIAVHKFSIRKPLEV